MKFNLRHGALDIEADININDKNTKLSIDLHDLL